MLFVALLCVLGAANAEYFPNSVFVFGPEIRFDVGLFAAQHAPALEDYSVDIMHWSGYYSINPEVVVMLMLQKDLPALKLEDELYPLFVAYYNNRNVDEEHAATNALQEFLGGDEALGKFVATFKSLFPARSLNVPFESLEGRSMEADQVSMAFPYGLGVSWFFNGIHTTSGSDNGTPMSSIDVTRTWSLRWGDFTGNDIVTSAGSGSVQVFSSCSVRVNHANGWSTHYYHLDNVTVSTGQFVNAGGRLSTYANQQQQALCNGGSSTGPHLHFSLLLNGNYYTLHNSYVSNYRMNAGRFSYDSSNAMYLERGGSRFYAYQTSLRNDGTELDE